MIGSNRLSLLYIQFIRAYLPGSHRIMAVLDDHPEVLDDRPEMIGRAIDGVRYWIADRLEPVVNEFAEHGIRISQVVIRLGFRDVALREHAS